MAVGDYKTCSWIDYRKAYDMGSQSLILACLTMFKVADNIHNLMRNSMRSWIFEWASGGEMLGEVKIKSRIFQGDLSPNFFVLAMILLSIVLNNFKAGYTLDCNRRKINHLLAMDDLKLYGKGLKEVNSLVETTRIYSNDSGKEFGISKCAMLEMKRGRVVDQTYLR